MKACIYVRISDDQTGQRAGVTRQLDDCEVLADRLGFEVVARYDDNDLSATNGKTRPGFETMLDAIKRGEFGAVLCWHPDRLYRSMRDLERLVDITDRVAIHTVNGGDIDLSNSTGKMLARILASVSAQEVEHKGERQRRANEQRRADGKWNRTAGRRFGYTKTGEPLEPEAAMIRRAATDVLAGVSLRSIAMDWNARGITTTRGSKWTSMQVSRTLVNPLYLALVTHNERVVGPGEWEPILDETTHRGLVAFLSDPTRKPAVCFERKHMGSTVYRCGVCGGPMHAYVPGGKKRAMTYACRPSNHVSRLAEPLDAYAESVALGVLSRTDIRTRLADRPDVDVDAIAAKRSAIAARLDELAGMFAQGAIDASQLRRGTSDLRAQLAGVDNVLAELARTSPAANLLKDGPDKLAERWQDATPDIRGKIIDELMTVTVMPAPRGRRGFDPAYVSIEPKI